MLGTLDFLERYNAGQLSEEERAAKTIEAERRGRGCRKNRWPTIAVHPREINGETERPRDGETESGSGHGVCSCL